jgi:A/G-specific adenine glycosylase
MDIGEFRKIILANYAAAGRDFPWRGKQTSPWGILVSEFMLQQTQTERVIPYFTRWMQCWPGPRDLANASLEEALREWSGLGYNRRCKYLRDCAVIIAAEKNGKVPRTPETLLPLPGIGPYMAGAISCFAYNYPSVFIETNIRSAVLHFFFPNQSGVNDNQIMPILEEAVDRDNPRIWYYALMDYGAALKKITANPNRRSAHYAKQSPFEGSFRQARGKVLRALACSGGGSAREIGKKSGVKKEELYQVLEALKKDSMVAETEGIYRITD